MSKNVEDREKEKEKLREKSLNREILAFTWYFSQIPQMFSFSELLVLKFKNVRKMSFF
jgi:hypothetical protein